LSSTAQDCGFRDGTTLTIYRAAKRSVGFWTRNREIKICFELNGHDDAIHLEVSLDDTVDDVKFLLHDSGVITTASRDGATVLLEEGFADGRKEFKSLGGFFTLKSYGIQEVCDSHWTLPGSCPREHVVLALANGFV
jgi:hypothetical protein